MIEAKKLAREELTACSDPAKEESIVSMSLQRCQKPINTGLPEELTFPKRLSIRPAGYNANVESGKKEQIKYAPWGVVSWNRNVARTTVSKSCLMIVLQHDDNLDNAREPT